MPSRHNEHFLLQAGSFRRSQDADRRRAELILQGYEARVQPVSLESGDTWHRVMIGPFNNVNALHRAQGQTGHRRHRDPADPGQKPRLMHRSRQAHRA